MDKNCATCLYHKDSEKYPKKEPICYCEQTHDKEHSNSCAETKGCHKTGCLCVGREPKLYPNDCDCKYFIHYEQDETKRVMPSQVSILGPLI